jgi:hypothetical protein
MRQFGKGGSDTSSQSFFVTTLLPLGPEKRLVLERDYYNLLFRFRP